MPGSDHRLVASGIDALGNVGSCVACNVTGDHVMSDTLKAVSSECSILPLQPHTQQSLQQQQLQQPSPQPLPQSFLQLQQCLGTRVALLEGCRMQGVRQSSLVELPRHRLEPTAGEIFQPYHAIPIQRSASKRQKL